ncbi:MAG: helix-turn-helix transcriptional regulator [Planctomycetes bacterium]|nr:helix-turn-helix transcriptional regulator [Planctomycetota bacterium]
MSQAPMHETISKLAFWRLYPYRLREELLKTLSEMVDAQGPCTLLQLNRFFSEGGRRLSEYHIRRPPRYRFLLWLPHIRAGQSEIERRIYLRRDSELFGVNRLFDMFTPEEWKQCVLSKIAEKCNVGDSVYVWIRCADDELWTACLRRTRQQPSFSTENSTTLALFAREFHKSKLLWYGEKLHKLSASEQEVLHLTAQGLTASEVAKNLYVSKRTVEAHLFRVRKKLNTQTTRAAMGSGGNVATDL